MKSYRNDRAGFEMDIPEEWSQPRYNTPQVPPGGSLLFGCKYYETFHLLISPRSQEKSPEQLENEFKRKIQGFNFLSLDFGRIFVGGKEHVCARYCLGDGKWRKKYLISFPGVEYELTATCFYQDMLADREKVWDAIVTSFHRLTGAETEGRSEAAPEVKPENGEGLKTGDKTLAFSLISYKLIVSLAVIYIHWKIGFAALYSFNNQAHFTHSVIAFIAVTFGIGALVCLIHLVGVIGNTLMLNNAASDFSFIDRTMQLRDSPNRTIGDRLFSDYTRKPKNGSDAFRLLNESLLHAILKIFTLPFSVGYLHPVITVVFAIS